MPSNSEVIKPKSINNVSSIINVMIFSATLLLSAFGYEFLFFVLTILIYDISHKAFAVGVFFAITFFPKMFSPFYGVLVDRYDRRILLAVNAGLVGILVFALGLTNQIAWIYVLWFIATIFIMFINNARTALMTEIMPNDNYIWGNSVILTILNTARLVAPLMAAFIMQWLEKKLLIAVSSLIYLLCMIMSLMIKVGENDKIELKRLSDTFYYIKEGVRYIMQNRSIKIMGTVGIFWRLFLGMQFSLFVVYVTKYLGKSEVEYGFFMTIIALGSLVGSLFGPFVAKKLSEKKLIMLGLTLHYASFSLLGMIRHYNISLIVGFISFCIFYITIVGIHSIRDKFTKANIRGRVYGASTFIFTPPTIISILLSGYLADIFGVEKVFIVSGVLAVISVIFVVSGLKLPASYKSHPCDAIE